MCGNNNNNNNNFDEGIFKSLIYIYESRGNIYMLPGICLQLLYQA